MKKIPENPQQIFGKAVKSLRFKKNITQQQLAKDSGLHFTYISSIEKGDRNVSLLNIIKIAQALSCDFLDLLGKIKIKKKKKSKKHVQEEDLQKNIEGCDHEEVQEL